MTNFSGSGRAVCPFYKGETGRSLQCEGFAPGARMLLDFRTAKAKRKWMEAHCEGFAYDRCPMAAMMMALYEDGEESGVR